MPVNPFTDGGPYQLEGRTMANSPERVYMLGYQHEWALDSGAIIASINARYSDGYYTTTEYYLSGGFQGSFTRTNGNVQYISNDEWSVNLWVKNIENEAQTSYVFLAHRRFVSPPLTYGLTFSYNF